MKPSPIFNLTLMAVAAGMPLVTNALTLTWDGDQGANWNADNAGDTNWGNSGSLLPVAGDDLSFGGIVTPSTNNDIAAETSFAGITFTNDGTVGTQDAPFTLVGNSITLSGNIISTATVEGTLEDTIDLDLIFDADRSILARTGHLLNVTGDISGDFILSLGLGGTNDEALVTLSGDNSQSQTRLNRFASVRAESNTALGNSVFMIRQSTLILADGIDLQVPGEGGIATLNGAGGQVFRLDEDGAAVASINANTTLTASNARSSIALNVGEDDTLTFNGIISGANNFTKNGLGSLVLTNALNDYTGSAILTEGTMTLGGSAVLGDVTSSTLNVNGGSLDLGTTSQTIGTLVISGAAASGETLHNGSISAATVNATNGADVSISANLTGAGNFTKSGAGILTLTGTNTYAGTTTVSAGSLVAPTAASLSGYDSLGSIIFDGGTIGVQVAGAGWTPGELDDLLINATKNSGGLGLDTTNGDFTPTAAFTPATLGALGLTKLGANSLILDQANTYTGNTTHSEGTLNLDNASALGATSGATFFITAGTTIDNTSGSALTLSNNPSVILPGDGFTFGGTNDLNLGTGTVLLNLPPNNTTRIITLNGTGSTLTLGDSYSPARGGNTNIQVDGAGNTLVFNSLGLNESGANRTNEWSGSANVTVLGGVLDAGIDGGQRFTYSGTGTFTIGGASTYTGNTTVSSGTLAIAAGGSLSDGTNVTINGGVIDLAPGVNDTIQNLTLIGENGDAPLALGTYGSSSSGADNIGLVNPDAYFTGAGIFTVYISPYTTWGGNAAFDADTNGDGVDNGLAWILGAASVNADALSLLPVPVESIDGLTMTFSVVDPIAPSQLFVEYNNDLLVDVWTSVEVPATSSTVDGLVFVIDGGTVSVTIPASNAVDGNLFSRLAATEN